MNAVGKYIQSVFFEAISTSVILLPVSALLGFDDNIWNILENELLRINLLFCCCFYIAVFSFWSNYGINWPRNASYKGIFSCWFTSACIMTFIEFHKKNKRKIIYCNLLFIIAAAFITQSRGWVLQTLVLLFVFVAVLGNRNRYVKFLMGLLLIFIAILGVSYVFPEITGNLFNRGVEDTRSGQYVIFFAQHSWKDLILGLGINASYSYLGNVNYVYGRYMKEREKLITNTVVTTVMSNFGLYKAFDELGIGYAKTAVGDKYVYEYMQKNGCRLGGEQSGHIIFSKYASTGDGILTSLKMMEVMMAKKMKMSQLTEDLHIYPQVLVNVKVKDKAVTQADKDVQDAVKKVVDALGDTGRILVRESGTEPLIRVMVEAETEEICRKHVDNVVSVIKEKETR